DLSTFDLTYRVPKGNEIVSVGKRVSDKTEGETHISVWKADRPIRVAGFNYGKFKKIERGDKDGGVQVEVYTNPGPPDIVREIDGYLQSRRFRSSGVDPNLAGEFGGISAEDLGIQVSSSRATAGLSGLHVDVGWLADAAIADGINTARICSTYFGP